MEVKMKKTWIKAIRRNKDKNNIIGVKIVVKKESKSEKIKKSKKIGST